MRLFSFLFLFLLLAGGFTAASAHSTKGTVSIKVRSEKAVARTGLRIRFVEMVEDSRCPVDTNCVWAGNAKVKIEVRGGRNGRQSFELNSNLAPAVVKYGGYEIKLVDLTPHPSSNIRINPSGYVARFEVKRSPK